MLKIRIALIFAFCAGTLTLFFCFVNNTRIQPLVFRVITSITIFAVCGYIVGSSIEKHLARLNTINNSGQNIDLKAYQQDVPVEINELTSTNPRFRPFTSANFEHISQPKH